MESHGWPKAQAAGSRVRLGGFILTQDATSIVSILQACFGFCHVI